jgi:hypothetical protein
VEAALKDPSPIIPGWPVAETQEANKVEADKDEPQYLFGPHGFDGHYYLQLDRHLRAEEERPTKPKDWRKWLSR